MNKWAQISWIYAGSNTQHRNKAHTLIVFGQLDESLLGTRSWVRACYRLTIDRIWVLGQDLETSVLKEFL